MSSKENNVNEKSAGINFARIVYLSLYELIPILIGVVFGHIAERFAFVISVYLCCNYMIDAFLLVIDTKENEERKKHETD